MKPANVLLDDAGTVKVTDFGLAATLARAGLAPGAVATATFGGMTSEFASPEQAAGRRAGRPSDVWSWALTVLALTGGRVWDRGEDRRTVHAALDDVVRGGLIPPCLAAVLRDCLVVDPSTRLPLPALDVRLREAHVRDLGFPYPRSPPDPAAYLADGLTNRGLSWLELGELDRADANWGEALDLDPRHVAATYHRSLLRWRRGQLTDALATDAVRALLADDDPGNPPEGAAMANALEQERGERRAAAAIEAHLGTVTALAIGADGTVVTGGNDGTVRRWDRDTGRLDRAWAGHGGRVAAVALLPDGRVASGGLDHTVRLHGGWLHGGWLRRDRILAGHTHEVVGLWVDAAGHRLVSTDVGGTLRCWDLATRRCLWTRWLREGVLATHVAPDGSRVWLAGQDGSVSCWTLPQGELRWDAAGHQGAVLALACGDQVVVSGSADTTVRMWDPDSGTGLGILTGHAAPVTAVAVSDGHIVSSADDGTVRRWDPKRLRCLRTDSSGYGGAAVLADAGGTVVAGDAMGALWRWSWRAGIAAPVFYCRPRPATEIGHHARTFQDAVDTAWAAARHDDVPRAVSSLTAARSVPGHERHPELRALEEALGFGQPRHALVAIRPAARLPNTHSAAVHSLAMTPDAAYVLSAGDDHTARWWATDPVELRYTLAGHRAPVVSVAVDASGARAVTGAFDGTAWLWDLDTGHGQTLSTGDGDRVLAVTITPDGSHVVAAGTTPTAQPGTTRGFLREHPPDAPARPLELPPGVTAVTAVTASADGRDIVAAARTREALRYRDGKRQNTSHHHAQHAHVIATAITPDAAHVLCAGRDGHVDLWDTLADAAVATPVNPPGPPQRTVVITADGCHGLGLDINGAARLWQLRSGEVLHEFPGQCTAATMTPRASHVATAGTDHTITLWELHWTYTPTAPGG